MYGFDLVTEGISAAFWCSLWAAIWAITLHAAPESNPDWMLFVAGTPLIYVLTLRAAIHFWLDKE
jgi:hypothetical protein